MNVYNSKAWLFIHIFFLRLQFFRVRVPLSNFPEFHKAFRCKAPEKTCTVWYEQVYGDVSYELRLLLLSLLLL